MSSEFGLDPGPGSVGLTNKNAYLLVLNGPKTGTYLSLNQSRLVIGREVSIEGEDKIELTGFEADSPPTISRRHAVIEWNQGVLQITDLGSTNGTEVNGERISPPTQDAISEPVLLQEGSRIKLGNLEFEVTTQPRVTATVVTETVDDEPQDFFVQSDDASADTLQEANSNKAPEPSELSNSRPEIKESNQQYYDKSDKAIQDIEKSIQDIEKSNQQFYDKLAEALIDISNQIETAFDKLAVTALTLFRAKPQLFDEDFFVELKKSIDKLEQEKKYDTARIIMLLAAIPIGLENVDWSQVREQVLTWRSYFADIHGDSAKIAANLIKSLILTMVTDPSIADNIQKYSEFLGELLIETEASGASEKVMYPRLLRAQDMLNENFAQVFRAYISAILGGLHRDYAQSLAEEILKLCILIQNFPGGYPSNNLTIAVTGYQTILDYLDCQSSAFGNARYALGVCYLNEYMGGDRQENLETARKHFEEALKVYPNPEQFFEPWVEIQQNIGIVYRELEQFEQAYKCFTSILESLNSRSPSLEWARIKVNLGLTLVGQSYDHENINAAISNFNDALEIFTKEAYPLEHAGVKYLLGVAYQTVKNNLEAKQAYSQAIVTIESLRDELSQGKGLEEDKQKLASKCNRIYQNMVEVCIARKEDAEAIEYVERSKARSFVQSISERNLRPRGNIQPDILNKFNNLRKKIKTEQQKIVISQLNDVTPPAKIAQDNLSKTVDEVKNDRVDRVNLSRWQQELDELIDEIQKEDPTFSLTQRVEPIQWAQIKSLISNEPEQQTFIVEWYVTDKNIYTFIIAPDRNPAEPAQPIVIPLKGDTRKLLELCSSQYSDEYFGDGNRTWQDSLSMRLKQVANVLEIDRIITAVREQTPDCKKLILIPHKFLHRFPLHALPLRDGRGLFELFMRGGGVCYAPSCQLLHLTKRYSKSKTDRRFFAIQNPTVDLEYSDIEVSVIQKFFNQEAPCILKKQDATKEAIQQALSNQNFNYLHLSCHAEVDFSTPIRSSLKLADGELTLGEVFELKLDECDLVTLSGCETGRIPDYLSEISDEYVSLASGFLYAGSSSVVSSLWRVDDLSTAFLMIKFYELLSQLDGKVAPALNQAQLWLQTADKQELQDMSKRLEPDLNLRQKVQLRDWIKKLQKDVKPFKDPDYWAPFCAIGQ
ncbi:MAG: CHAT domain-containing protein [Xenococcaceae cyanobacterium]